ncbi:OmpA family protein [Chitinophaga sp. GCM10012297]|uniref:OmpA family protein n=1 Tax=Chitinophaga chungangae TaxID=2821488 RepID=A0ABS3YKM6_9BACT|nr:OmpA family protein [Chitinophaga chungangae]MBO9155255.1 OmpA family protein [Chitinophaga chungangae]
MKKNTLRWAFFLMAASPLTLVAQNPEPEPATTTQTPKGGLFGGSQQFRTFSIGVNGGVLVPAVATGGSNDFTKWQLNYGYGAYVKWQLLHFLGLRADFVGGKLKGDNSKELGNGENPNRAVQSFETSLNWSGSLNAVFNLATINWLHRQSAAQLYVSVGGGLAGYKPTITTPGGITRDYKSSGSINEFFVPVGAGVKFKLSDFMNLDLGYTMHYLDGDNLDGFNYGPSKDRYAYGYAGLEFALGDRTKPQLAWHNAPAVMYDDLVAQKEQLKLELDAEKENNAKLAASVAKLQADSDGDGVSDLFDKCPNTPATDKVDGSGCPLPKDTVKPAPVKVIITEDDRRLVRDAIANLEFATGKSNILPKSFASLDRVADLMVRKNLSLKLAGHTDNVGTEANNMRLSKDRAESVKSYLTGKGVNPSRIEATGYGELQPIATNKTAAGRQKNRRVEFTIF